MLFNYVKWQQQIGNNTKCRRIPGDFYCHADAAVRYGAHRPIEHNPGITRSHWMPPSGKCLSRIAPAAAMVNKFVETTLITNKTQILASDYRTFLLVKAKQFWDPKWILYLAHWSNEHCLNLKLKPRSSAIGRYLWLAEAEAANIVEETTILRSSKKVVADMRQLWLSCYGNNFSHQWKRVDTLFLH